jgi:DnaJ-class molecular chaperone
MQAFRTHYDNLKVSRDAPDIVIRAAYRSLSQRFHPDKNNGDERAVRVMAVINQSYEILIDPNSAVSTMLGSCAKKPS